MAEENPAWGYDRMQGALANLGHPVSGRTVGNILKAHGIEPAPDRKPQSTWKTFLEPHRDVLASIDLATIEAWTMTGPVTCYPLFVMELATRRVCFAGSAANPDELWMVQIAGNLSDPEHGFLGRKRFLIMDRDAKFCEEFRATLTECEIDEPYLCRAGEQRSHQSAQ